MIIRRLGYVCFLTVAAVVVGTLFIVALYSYGLLPIIIVTPFVLFKYLNKSHISTTLGSARLANYADLIMSGMLYRPSGMILGKLRKVKLCTPKQGIVALFNLPLSYSREAVDLFTNARSVDQTVRLDEHRYSHVAYFAPNGQGKSAGYAIPNLQDDDSTGVVVLDFKGELLRETAFTRMKRFNHDVVCFAPFGLPKGFNFPTVTFNPLHLIDPESRYYLDHSAAIAKSLIVRQASEHQPFFNDAAEMIITSFLAAMIAESPKSKCTLGNLRKVLSLPHLMEELTKYMMENAKRYPDQMEQLAGPVLSLQGDARFSVISTINSQLRWLDSIPVAQSMATTSFDPARLFHRKRGLTLYIHIPVHLMHAYTGLIRVIFSSLINFIFEQGESSTRCIRFYLDESQGLGQNLDSLRTALIRGRSYGIKLAFFFQSLSQIGEVFEGPQATDFMANIVPVFTGIRDMETARQVSSWIGRYTVRAAGTQNGVNTNVSRSFSDRGGMGVSKGIGLSSSWTAQEQSRELIMPEEILQLPERTSIITVPHMPPMIASPEFYFLDKQRNRLAKQSRKYILRAPKKAPLLLLPPPAKMMQEPAHAKAPQHHDEN